MKWFWFIIGGPKDINEAKLELLHDFENSKKNLLKEMNQEQSKFEIEMETIANAVEVFENLNDI